jgi:hypothetical protein
MWSSLAGTSYVYNEQECGIIDVYSMTLYMDDSYWCTNRRISIKSRYPQLLALCMLPALHHFTTSLFNNETSFLFSLFLPPY